MRWTSALLLAGGATVFCPAADLPSYCGNIGPARFQSQLSSGLWSVPEPAFPLERGATITVTTSSDLQDGGDVSSVTALLARPGSDGISLREAITATNNQPGSYTIRFAAALKGATLRIGPAALPELTGGNVTITGDMDGDGAPDLRLVSAVTGMESGAAFRIASSGNTLHALDIEFPTGISLRLDASERVYSGNSFVNNTLRSCAIIFEASPPASRQQVLKSRTRWVDTLIAGNTLPAIGLAINFVAGASVERTVVTGNFIRETTRGVGIALATGYWAGSDGSRISDTVIAGNRIEGSPRIGILVSAAAHGGSRNLMQRTRIFANRFQVTSEGAEHPEYLMGIQLNGGDAGTDDADMTLRPVVYPKDNVIDDVWIVNNTFEGYGGAAVDLLAGCNGAERNRITNVFIIGNTIGGRFSNGVLLEGGGNLGVAERKTTASNLISHVVVDGNTIATSWPKYGLSLFGSAIALLGGREGAEKTRTADIWVSHNELSDTGYPGLLALAGFGFGGTLSDATSLSGVTAWCNRVTSKPVDWSSQAGIDAKGIVAGGGLGDVRNNIADRIRLEDNLVNGVLNDVTFFDSLSASAQATGARATPFVAPPAPQPDVVPAGVMNGASFVNEPLAPGSFATIFGANLSTRTATAAPGALPASLAGTTIRLGGVAVPLYSLSPTQINFQVPWELAGQTNLDLVVATEGVESAPQNCNLAALGPGLLMLDAQRQAAALISGTGIIAAPSGRFPGSRPAKRGETIEFYATGLGPVSNQPASGAPGLSSPLSITRAQTTVTVGGVTAATLFSGLAPGLPGVYQVNVTVPDVAPAGNAVAVRLRAAGVQSNVATIAVE